MASYRDRVRRVNRVTSGRPEPHAAPVPYSTWAWCNCPCCCDRRHAWLRTGEAPCDECGTVTWTARVVERPRPPLTDAAPASEALRAKHQALLCLACRQLPLLPVPF